MRRGTLIVIAILLVVAACAPKITVYDRPRLPTERHYASSYDTTWNAVVQVMAEWPLTIIERESGILNTDWLARKSSYAVSIDEPILGRHREQMPVELMERLIVLVQPKGDSASVEVIRYVKLRPYRYVSRDRGWVPGIGEFMQTTSDTHLEAEILGLIEYALYSSKLE